MTSKRPTPTGGHDPFDLWLKQSLRDQWGQDPAREVVPSDLLRLVCDTRSEWAEMRERWGAKLESRRTSLD